MSSDPEKQREFVSLIIAHQPNLRAFIISLMPGIEGAADVLQEVNLVLWEKMGSFELGTNFQAWAFQIARFEVKAHIKRLHRKGITALPESFVSKLAADFDSAYEADPELAETRLAALRLCLDRLPAEDRQLVETRYAGETNIKSFAEQLETPAATLRVRLHRIREALRKCITERLRLNAIHNGRH